MKVSGDTLRADERSLVVVNHRSSVDLAGLASALFHASNPMAANVKLVLGAEHKSIPGFGKKANRMSAAHILIAFV